MFWTGLTGSDKIGIKLIWNKNRYRGACPNMYKKVILMVQGTCHRVPYSEYCIGLRR